jgi:hypothetical protein
MQRIQTRQGEESVLYVFFLTPRVLSRQPPN